MNIQQITRYMELGFIIHPCCPPSHKCASPGKIPYNPDTETHLGNWQAHGQYTLKTWKRWIDLCPRMNLGMLCGAPSGLTLIDIDNQEGEELYGEFDRSGRTSPSWIFITGKGRRILFRDDEGGTSFKIPTGSGEHLEILSNGRQSVIPPSVHATGREYAWVDGFTPRDFDAGLLPAVFRGEGGGHEGSGAGDEVSSTATDWEAELEKIVPQGGRNEFLTKLVGHLFAPTPLSVPEVRLWVNLYNQDRCKPPLNKDEIETIIWSIKKREDDPVKTMMEDLIGLHGYSPDQARRIARAELEK